MLIFQQLRSILLCKDAFQTHLWQKLAFSSPFCYSNDLSSIISFGGIVTLLFSLTISIREDRVLFLLIHLTGVSCFHSSSLILSSFPSFLNWRAVWNPSYPLCHSFNSSGGSVLLILSSIISSSQVHVQFLQFTVGVLPNYIILIHSYLVSTRVVPIPSCPLYSSFIALQPPRFTWCFLFLFSTAVLSTVFNSVVFSLSTFQPLKVRGFTHLSKKQLSLPPLFLFRFPPVPS